MHKKRYIFPKRIFDVVLALTVIVTILSWMVPLIALLIFIESNDKTFFKQKRIGKNGKPFDIFKFKSMTGNPPVNDPLLSIDEFARITKIGRFMRKYRIDEFPQFINVLKGEAAIEKYGEKGKKVAIHGRMVQRTYLTQNGKQRSLKEVEVRQIIGL